MEVLEQILKFPDQSSNIFELSKKLDSPYKVLTKAIENRNDLEIINVLYKM